MHRRWRDWLHGKTWEIYWYYKRKDSEFAKAFVKGFEKERINND